MEMLTAHVRNAEHMMTQVVVTNEGIGITFADGCKGVIPFREIPEVGNPSALSCIELPNPYQINIQGKNRKLVELPWDFVRHYCDATYKPRIESIAIAGMKALGKQIRAIREAAGMTQLELAKAAGIGRITEVRIENGEQSPRYNTLVAIAQALKHPINDIIIGVSEIKRGDKLTEIQSIDESGNTEESSPIVVEEVDDSTRGVVLKAKVQIEQALDSALNNDWKTSLRLLKEAATIVPDEYYSYIELEIRTAWLCIQKTSIGPLIARAEKSMSIWDYLKTSEILEEISSILDTAKLPLDYEDYSIRVINITRGACGAADRWKNSFDNKLDRTLIGVSVVKSHVEELIEKKNIPIRYRSYTGVKTNSTKGISN